jgi:plasmid replication initiation protein
MTFATKNLNELAYQHNDLVRAPLKLTHVEARIFALGLACLHQHSDSLEVSIAIVDVVKSSGGAAYDLVKAGCLGLTSKPVRVESEKAGLRTLVLKPLFKLLKLDEGTGHLTGKFNDELRDYLLQLNGQYTRVEIETLLTLKSAHAHRLYWILKSWEKPSGAHTFEFDMLRKMFLGEESDAYSLWTDFKRYVLEPAKKELHELSWLVEYQEHKTGKKVSSVSFTIPLQQQAQSDTANIKTKLTFAQAEEYRKHLTAKYPPLLEQYNRMQLQFNLSEYQARKVANHIKDEEMFKKLTVTLRQVQLSVINNQPMETLVKFTVNKLKEAFPEVFKK